jgi:hypothetical protein
MPIRNMGYDFYTYYKLCIEYKDDNDMAMFTHKFDDERERHDWWEVERDEDFEEWDVYHKRLVETHKRQIEYIYEMHYPRVDLCCNGLWKCLPSAKSKYLTIAAEEAIPAESIVNVWKEGDYYAY